MSARWKSILDAPLDELFAYILIVAVLLCECSFFFMDFLPSWFFRICNYNYKYLTALFAVIGFIVYLVSNDKKEKYAFATPIIALQMICFFTALSSSIKYDMNLSKALLQAFPIITIPLLYFDLHLMIDDESIYDFFIEASIVISSLYAFTCILQSLGLDSMNESYQFFSYRNNRLRIVMSGDFVSYGAILALGRVYGSEKHRLTHIILLNVMLFELFWVAQTRFFFIGLALAALIGFIIEGKNKGVKIILTTSAVLLLSLQFSNKLVDIIFPQELSYSADARINAYSYYWSHVLDMGLFGLGYAPRDSYLFGLVNIGGSIYRGDITDIGVIGFFARYGIAGIIILVISCGIFIQCLMKCDKKSFSKMRNPEAWMMLIFWVAISPTMAITDPQRIFYLPVLALMLEHTLMMPSINDVK